MNEREERVAGILLQLERRGSKRNRDGMARYGITARKAFGVPVAKLHEIRSRLGRDHRLALALWDTGWHEARQLAALIDDPAQVRSAQMEKWVRGFDNWALCDTCCMHLFDRTRLAWDKADAWSRRTPEFVKRAGFALVASLALHDKEAPDAPFRLALRWVAREAKDDRNFVKKAVNWALRAVGERSPALRRDATALATTLAGSTDATARWIGKDALRQLASPASRARTARHAKARAARPRAGPTRAVSGASRPAGGRR